MFETRGLTHSHILATSPFPAYLWHKFFVWSYPSYAFLGSTTWKVFSKLTLDKFVSLQIDITFYINLFLGKLIIFGTVCFYILMYLLGHILRSVNLVYSENFQNIWVLEYIDHFINVSQINFLCALFPNMFFMYIRTLFIKNKILLEVSMLST